MDIKKATFDIVANIVQRSLGRSSRKTSNLFLNMKLSSWINAANKSNPPIILIKVNTIVTHRDPEALRLTLRAEALEAVRETLRQVVVDYKEEAKKHNEVTKAMGHEAGTNPEKPAKGIKLELLGMELVDSFQYISTANKAKVANYHFEIKARILS